MISEYKAIRDTGFMGVLLGWLGLILVAGAWIAAGLGYAAQLQLQIAHPAFMVAMLIICVLLIRTYSRVALRIVWPNEGAIQLILRRRVIEIEPASIRSLDSKRGGLINLRHDGGHAYLSPTYEDFDDFLQRLRHVNPGVEIEVWRGSSE